MWKYCLSSQFVAVRNVYCGRRMFLVFSETFRNTVLPQQMFSHEICVPMYLFCFFVWQEELFYSHAIANSTRKLCKASMLCRRNRKVS